MTEYGKQIGPAELEFVRRFDADIEKVWQFLVDPEKRKLWFCGGSTDANVGGAIIFDFDHRRLSDSPPPQKYASEEIATHRGTILEYDPPNRLAFDWFESAGGEKSRVEIDLAAIDAETTELKLVHRGVLGHDMLIGVFAGWHGHFDLLAEVLHGPRKTDFWLHDQALEAEYERRIPAG
ncbi:MAG: SRPBCC family protein [Erythrobacter sp.]